MERSNFSQTRYTDFQSRLCAQWRLKLLGLPAFIVIFFLAYFLLLRFPLFAVRPMPVTAIDEAIAFQPVSLVIYFSLWFYVCMAAALLRTRAELMFHAKVAGAMGLVGFAIFFFWPTAVPAAAGLRETDVATLSWLKQVDAAGNACPSLHVAFAVFSGLWLNRSLKEMRLPLGLRLVNAAWCVAIAYSTLATKQHVLVDVFAGGILGTVAGAIQYSPRSAASSPAALGRVSAPAVASDRTAAPRV
jgi:membrane-associated phospholipid phosphatase